MPGSYQNINYQQQQQQQQMMPNYSGAPDYSSYPSQQQQQPQGLTGQNAYQNGTSGTDPNAQPQYYHQQ